jgi:putative component of membrane protein insertase Oxa1/YidC/SpoIIIJ protein YidD
VSTVARNVIRAIEWYQRALSPHKGFACAYRVAWGGHSCSAAVKRAFAERGSIGGAGALFAQPFKCHAAARILVERSVFREAGAGRPTALFCCFLPF